MTALVSERRPRTALGIARSGAVGFLLVAATLLALLTPPAIWARDLVLDTDRYLQAMEPIGRDPGVQAAVVKAIDAQFATHVNVVALAQQVLPAQADFLAAPAQSAIESYIHDVTARFVAGSTFAAAWDTINRQAHLEVVAILTGRQADVGAATVQILGDRVVLDLSPVVVAVRQQLVAAGLTIAAQVPSVGVVIDVARLKGVESARTYTRLLDRLATWLPWLTLLCLAGAALLARNRRRTLLFGAAGVAGAMVVLSLALVIARHAVISGASGGALDDATLGRVLDSLTHWLRVGVRSTLLLALVVLIGAWLAGPASGPTAVRHVAVAAPRAITGRWTGGPAGAFVRSYRTPLRCAVLIVAVLVLVLWTNPSLAVLAVIAVVTLAVLATVESLARVVPDH